MAVTIKELAARCGVSAMTVSDILNGKGIRFREETRRRVLEEARRCQYRPNRMAKAVRSGMNAAVALAVGSEQNLWFSQEMVYGALEVLVQHGMQLSIFKLKPEDLSLENPLSPLFTENCVAGVLLNHLGLMNGPVQARFDRLGLPYVWMNARLCSNCVYPDDAGAVAAEVGRLVGLGHRRIMYAALLHPFPHQSYEDRLSGYIAAMRDAVLAPMTLITPVDLAPGQADGLARKILAKKNRPTAVIGGFGVHDAIPFLLAARERGIGVPDGLALSCVGGVRKDNDHTGISIIRLPFERVGREAAMMLVGKLRGEVEAEAAPVTVPFADS